MSQPTSGTQKRKHITTTTTKYTRRSDDSGWLIVLLSSNNSRTELCEYTKVELTRKKDGRVFFRISDGNNNYIGQEASLKEENATKYLVDTPPKGVAHATVKYNGKPKEWVSKFKGKLTQQPGILSLDGVDVVITLNSIWDKEFTPIPTGKHRVMTPDRSHANISTGGYRDAVSARCTDVWFPIELQGTTGNSSRYIHIGNLSEGCVTVYELEKWNLVYDYLISKRIPGTSGKYIGELVVSK